MDNKYTIIRISGVAPSCAVFARLFWINCQRDQFLYGYGDYSSQELKMLALPKYLKKNNNKKTVIRKDQPINF